MLLISPAINLADWFENQGKRHGWTEQNAGAADAFMPNNTGDGSGPLQYAATPCVYFNCALSYFCAGTVF